jgi:SAM-dependent methyltransferase
VTAVGEDATDAAAADPSPQRSGLLYDESYYRTYEGGSYDRGGHWTRFFGYIADEVVARWAPATTLDAGCALGIFVEELRHRGVQSWGVDISEFAVGAVSDEVRPYCFVGSLAEELPEGLPRRYDLVSCIEVLEHMERAEGDRAVGRLCAVTDRILFSSTPDGYREPTHFTCRTPEEWSAVFARYGFVRSFDTDASFVAPWAVVYERRELTPYELVLTYDRQHARLQEENRQLRAEVIELDKKAAQSGDAALHERIATLRLELMAARDQAVGALAQRDAALARRSDESRQVAERTRARTEAEVEARMRRSDVWRLGSQMNRVVRRAGRVRRLLRRSGDPR